MTIQRNKIILTTDKLTQKRSGGTAWEHEFKYPINELKDNALSFDELQGHVDGLNISYVSATVIQISTGSCIADSVDDYIVSNSTINVDNSASGANGNDIGFSTNNNWYYVWMIKNPTTSTVAGLLSLSPTSPTMPSGYTKKRLIGVLRYGTATFIKFYQTGIGTSREFLYESAQYIVTQAQPTAGTWTSVSATSFVPTTLRSWGLVSLSFYAENVNSTQTALVYAAIRQASTTGTGSLVATVNALNANDAGDSALVGWVKQSGGGSYEYQRSSNSGLTRTFVDVAICGYRIEI